MFVHEARIWLRNTDAAGVLFFADLFQIIHDTYEAFLEENGSNILSILDSQYRLPIVHAEADYRLPLLAGSKISIEAQVESIGESSFVMNYRLLDVSGRLVCSAKTVHVSIDKVSGGKIGLPGELRHKLERSKGRAGAHS